MRFLAAAVDDLRRILSLPNQSSVRAWTLLYASKSLAAGTPCFGYTTPDAYDRLVAEVSTYLSEET
jgi:hypothetical protein